MKVYNLSLQASSPFGGYREKREETPKRSRLASLAQTEEIKELIFVLHALSPSCGLCILNEFMTICVSILLDF